jgi:ankyrin repeat protein
MIGHTNVVQLLLAAQAAVNTASAKSITALHHAAIKGHTTVAQLLLANHADVNAADADGQTPIYWAAHSGMAKTVQLLLAAPQLASKAMAGVAKAAAARGHTDLAIAIMKVLIARDGPTADATAMLARQPVASKVLRLWQAAEDTVREEARWSELQQLLLGIAGTHQQLQAAAGGISASAVIAAMQAAGAVLGEAASDAAIAAGGAASTSAAAAVASVAPLTQGAAEAAAAAAVAP